MNTKNSQRGTFTSTTFFLCTLPKRPIATHFRIHGVQTRSFIYISNLIRCVLSLFIERGRRNAVVITTVAKDPSDPRDDHENEDASVMEKPDNGSEKKDIEKVESERKKEIDASEEKEKDSDESPEIPSPIKVFIIQLFAVK